MEKGKETDEKKHQKWGRVPDLSAMKKARDATGCPYCGCGDGSGIFGVGDMFGAFIVGFSNMEDEFVRSDFGLEREGAEIIECPNCFEHFWRHALYCFDIEIMRVLLVDMLKVPGAKEALLEFLAKEDQS